MLLKEAFVDFELFIDKGVAYSVYIKFHSVFLV